MKAQTMTKRLDGVNVPSTPENNYYLNTISASGAAECIEANIV